MRWVCFDGCCSGVGADPAELIGLIVKAVIGGLIVGVITGPIVQLLLRYFEGLDEQALPVPVPSEMPRPGNRKETSEELEPKN